jgi:hypothetical protein
MLITRQRQDEPGSMVCGAPGVIRMSVTQRELAESIARDTHGVHKVQNDRDIAALG